MTVYSVHTKVRDFVGRQPGVDRRELQVRAAQYYERKAKASGNLWDILRARDYYYLAMEWETAADIVIGAWQYIARWGHIQLAMGLLQQSVDTTSGDIKAIATGNLAILYQNVGDLKTALRLHGEVKEIFEAQGDRRNVAISLHQLGNVHYLQGNYFEAVKLYEQSLEIKKDLGDKSGIASSLSQIGRIKEENRDLEGALGDYFTALSIFEDLLDPSREIAKKWIARLKETMGEESFQSVLAKFGGSQ